jgi:hypothetical protein
MAADWQHCLTEGSKLLTVGVIGFVLGQLKDLRKWSADRAEKRRRNALNLQLRGRAKEQETLHRHNLDRVKRMNGFNTKDRTAAIQRAADNALEASKAYREAGDTIEAMKWEQVSRNTIP